MIWCCLFCICHLTFSKLAVCTLASVYRFFNICCIRGVSREGITSSSKNPFASSKSALTKTPTSKNSTFNESRWTTYKISRSWRKKFKRIQSLYSLYKSVFRHGFLTDAPLVFSGHYFFFFTFLTYSSITEQKLS